MITTGPGVIRPMATASTNSRSVSQPCSSTRPACRKGTIASPEPNVNALACRKKRLIVGSEAPEPIQAKPLIAASSGRGERLAAQAGQAAAVVDGAEDGGGEEGPDDLLAGHHGRDRLHGGDRPQDGVVLVAGARELVGGDGDDREHGGGDAEADVLDER